MPSRRTVLAGFAHLLVGAGVMKASATTPDTMAPTGDFRILADVRRGLELRPGRDDEAHVVTDDDGLVTEIVLAAPGGHGVSKAAETRFGDIVEVHKLPPGPPIDELYFEFEVVDEGLDPSGDPTPTEIESALLIVAADGDVPADGSQNFLQATDEGDAHNDLLSPNQHVPFGVGVDLLSSGITDLPDPDRFGIRLRITAEHLPRGPPGGSSDP